jgi:hypothetical protein
MGREEHVRRRDFIKAIAGSAAARPLAARAQRSDRVRRIGVLMNLAADDPESAARNAAFLQSLQQLGWTDGRNVRIDYRWGGGDQDRIRKYAAELVALAPDVILPSAEDQSKDMQEAARAIGLHIHVLRANTDREIEAAFEIVARDRIGALAVAASPFFDTRRDALVALAARHADQRCTIFENLRQPAA